MHDIIHAIRNEFEYSLILHGQPIVPCNGDASDPQWYELLLRLVDPRRGLLLPVDFLPEDDRDGILQAIDRWVFNEAAVLMARYPNLHFSVNFSRHILGNPFLNLSLAALFDGLNAKQRLTLEISEKDLQWATDEIEQLAGLRSIVRLSADDVGHAPLEQLVDLRDVIDGFKVDGSLMGKVLGSKLTAEIVHNLIGLALHQDLICVCEHIENNDLWDWVRMAAKDYPGVKLYCQGYAVGEFKREW